MSFPEEWHEQEHRHDRVGKVGAAAIVILLLGAGSAVGSNNGVALFLLSAAMLLLIGLIAIHHVTSAAWKRGRDGASIRFRSHVDQYVTLVPYSRRAEYSRQALHAYFMLFCFALPWMASHLPATSSRFTDGFSLLAPAAPLLGAVMVPYLLSPIIRGGAEMGIGLSSRGVYRWSWFGCCFYSWKDLEGISTRREGALAIDLNPSRLAPEKLAPGENWLSRSERYRRRMSVIHGGYLAINPAVALRLVQFYHQHPELRHELGTEASLERIRNGDFDVEDEPADSGAD